MIEKKKGGRPRLADSQKRTIKKEVAFSPGEFDQLKKLAKERGITPAEFLRSCALNPSAEGRKSEDDKSLMRTLAGMANNLNQIAKLNHATRGNHEITVNTKLLLTEMRKLLNS